METHTKRSPTEAPTMTSKNDTSKTHTEATTVTGAIPTGAASRVFPTGDGSWAVEGDLYPDAPIFATEEEGRTWLSSRGANHAPTANGPIQGSGSGSGSAPIQVGSQVTHKTLGHPMGGDLTGKVTEITGDRCVVDTGSGLTFDCPIVDVEGNNAPTASGHTETMARSAYERTALEQGATPGEASSYGAWALRTMGAVFAATPKSAVDLYECWIKENGEAQGYVIPKGRTMERVQFLADVLVTGVETGYPWFSWSNYRHEYTFPYERGTDAWRQAVAETSVTVYPDTDGFDDPADGPGDDGQRITVDTVAHAIRRMVEADSVRGLNPRHVATIAEANRTNDAGEIDADLADCILQFAVYGEIVFG